MTTEPPITDPNVLSARLIDHLSHLVPGTGLGSSPEIADRFAVGEDTLVAVLHHLAELGWVERRTHHNAPPLFVAGRRAGTEWPMVRQFITETERR